MANRKIMEFYNTLRTQVEILPRLTIIYGKGYHKGFAIEWLWFGVFHPNNSNSPKPAQTGRSNIK